MQKVKLNNTGRVLKCALSVFFLFFIMFNGYSQYWERFYGSEDYKEGIFDIAETYDKGYLLAVRETEPDYPSYKAIVKVIKTDINGNILWKRNILKSHIAIRGSKPLPDGSFVCTSGYWDTVNEMWNLMIYRIDACGNEMWCKDYIDPLGQGFQSTDIDIIGDKIVFANQRIPIGPDENPYTLIMLDLDGKTICEKPFLLQEDYPLMACPTIYKVVPLPNNEFMVLGAVYYPKEPNGTKWLRSMFVKFDTDGNEQWMLPFGVNDTIIAYRSKCENVIVEDSGKYFAFIGTYENPRKLLLMKFDDQGNELGHVISPLDSVFGCPNPYFVGAQKIGSNRYLNLLHFTKNNSGLSGKAIVVVDSTLSHLYDTLYLNIEDLLAYTWIKSFDGKYLLSGYDIQSDDVQGYFNKVSLDPLSFDTMYTATYTYDSLCPGIAYADTLYFEDCELMVGENDIQYELPTQTPLVVYPNPATEELTVSLGSATHTAAITLTIHTLTGEVQWQGILPPGEQSIRLSVHAWPKGIYLVSGHIGNEVVGREKIVVM